MTYEIQNVAENLSGGQRRIAFGTVIGLVLLQICTNKERKADGQSDPLSSMNDGCCQRILHPVNHPYSVSIENALQRLRDVVGFVPSTILDVGASEGEWSRSVKKIFPNATFTLVEGNSDFQSRLQEQNIGRVEIALVAEAKKKVTYFKNQKAHTGNSIFRENTQYFQEDNADVVQVTEFTKSIDEITRGERVDLMKLDVQGAEKLALMGARKTLKSVHVLTLEVSILPYNDGAPLAMEVIGFLDGLGFHIFDITELHVMSAGILFQMDMTFIHKNSCVWENLLHKSGLILHK